MACYGAERQRLRRALADIKVIMGTAYERLFLITNGEIGVDLNLVTYLGQPGASEFLEGMEIREDRFNDGCNPSVLIPLRFVPYSAPAAALFCLQRGPRSQFCHLLQLVQTALTMNWRTGFRTRSDGHYQSQTCCQSFRNYPAKSGRKNNRYQRRVQLTWHRLFFNRGFAT